MNTYYDEVHVFRVRKNRVSKIRIGERRDGKDGELTVSEAPSGERGGGNLFIYITTGYHCSLH